MQAGGAGPGSGQSVYERGSWNVCGSLSCPPGRVHLNVAGVPEEREGPGLGWMALSLFFSLFYPSLYSRGKRVSIPAPQQGGGFLCVTLGGICSQ